MKRMWSKNEIANQKKDIATLVDSQGHNRFIEGDITIEEITGVTQTYGKWSLSGTHLMIVIAISVEDATSLSGELAKINLPDWIKSKLVPIYSTYIARSVAHGIGGGSDIDYNLNLQKSGDNVSVKFYNTTTTRAENMRVEFDLLIDNE